MTAPFGARTRAQFHHRATAFAVFAALAGLVGSRARAAALPELMPIDDVKVGMKGVGRSVFRGDTIEEFGIEVLSVMHRTRPQGDLVLFRAEGEFLEHTGIIAGMSGSPVYIDGKLLGAIAFAYPNGKDPIGAITPAVEMLPLLDADLSLPPREEQDGTLTTQLPTKDGDSRTAEPGASAGPRFEQLWSSFLTRSHESDPVAGTPEQDGAELAPVSLPLSLSGWAAPLREEMQATLGNLGFTAMSSPGGGKPGDVPVKPLEPGSAVSLPLVMGDADLAAVGTVTYVDGDKIIAFGHPMVQAGRVAFPMGSAWIYGVIPNTGVSVKMGSSTGLIGAITNDRRTGIAGKVGPTPDMLPVRVAVREESGAWRQFHYQVVRQAAFTPFFLPWTVSNSYLATGWSMGDALLSTDCSVYFNGGRKITRHESIASDSPSQAIGGDVAMPANLLLVNPFEKVRLDSVAVSIDYRRGIGNAKITEVRCTPVRAEVGDTLRVEVDIEPFRGATQTKRVEIPITGAWAGRRLRVLAASTQDFVEWDQDRAPEKFEPHSMRQMLEMITRVPDDATFDRARLPLGRAARFARRESSCPAFPRPPS
ncbi:MAG: SpoIVB peptidase S55 domain-containing protein [Candidatus Eisenbacteria bacterium]